jgi:hypothetical protein
MPNGCAFWNSSQSRQRLCADSPAKSPIRTLTPAIQVPRRGTSTIR